ncbi:DUF1298 domain-containing protein [Mycobacterium sp. ACS4331]|uniref:DUF1298 domain-containing protein n=1 Tax=Mycobacterium sp. ACS4331 TaxID=1834121 RepID=UPI0007FE8AEF|nr:DUF1298 domain-containing protein [Mycobacterium sp. ACS4331]OBF30121.1 DUF1298 domain-containing protein [Mycobacterium sp. ACS4331]
MPRLEPVDAQTYWLAAKLPSDQFPLYAFAGAVDIGEELLDGLARRAAACPDLGVRIEDDCALRYPRWVPAPPTRTQFVVHDGVRDWAGCLDAVGALADRQLDPRRSAWRLHLFTAGAPTGDGVVTVAVLQIAHALADGTRAGQLAGWLFGRDAPVPVLPQRRRGGLVRHGVAAARTHRALVADIEAGRIPAPPPPRPALLTNAAPAGPRRIRTVVTDRGTVAHRGGTVTIGALVAIGAALDAHLRARGEDTSTLCAEVPMAKPGIRYSRNHFRNVGVGLYPDLPAERRAEAIAADLRAAHLRAEHPATVASGESFAATPAVLLRWGVAQFDAGVRSPVVTGNTVVSSVNRGSADLRLDGAPVVLTAGYPALSPMMGVTHGVHGIGDTIAVSVHAADSVMTQAQLDDYVGILQRALAVGQSH